MNGSNWVATAIRMPRSLPMLRFAATWSLACGSQPPSETSIEKVSNSRVLMSIPVRVRWSPKQLADNSRWMCLSSSDAEACICSTRSSPTICFCKTRPFWARVSGMVVDWPSSGSLMSCSVRTSLVVWMKSNTLPMPT